MVLATGVASPRFTPVRDDPRCMGVVITMPSSMSVPPRDPLASGRCTCSRLGNASMGGMPPVTLPSSSVVDGEESWPRRAVAPGRPSLSPCRLRLRRSEPGKMAPRAPVKPCGLCSNSPFAFFLASRLLCWHQAVRATATTRATAPMAPRTIQGTVEGPPARSPGNWPLFWPVPPKDAVPVGDGELVGAVGPELALGPAGAPVEDADGPADVMGD